MELTNDQEMVEVLASMCEPDGDWCQIAGNTLIDPSKLLTTGEAAEMCKDYSQRGLQAAIKRGDLRAFRIGHRDYILRSDLFAFVTRMEQIGNAKYDVWARGLRSN
jgi:hypothetical protein